MKTAACQPLKVCEWEKMRAAANVLNHSQFQAQIVKQDFQDFNVVGSFLTRPPSKFLHE